MTDSAFILFCTLWWSFLLMVYLFGVYRQTKRLPVETVKARSDLRREQTKNGKIVK